MFFGKTRFALLLSFVTLASCKVEQQENTNTSSAGSNVANAVEQLIESSRRTLRTSYENAAKMNFFTLNGEIDEKVYLPFIQKYSRTHNSLEAVEGYPYIFHNRLSKHADHDAQYGMFKSVTDRFKVVPKNATPQTIEGFWDLVRYKVNVIPTAMSRLVKKTDEGEVLFKFKHWVKNWKDLDDNVIFEKDTFNKKWKTYLSALKAEADSLAEGAEEKQKLFQTWQKLSNIDPRDLTLEIGYIHTPNKGMVPFFNVGGFLETIEETVDGKVVKSTKKWKVEKIEAAYDEGLKTQHSVINTWGSPDMPPNMLTTPQAGEIFLEGAEGLEYSGSPVMGKRYITVGEAMDAVEGNQLYRRITIIDDNSGHFPFVDGAAGVNMNCVRLYHHMIMTASLGLDVPFIGSNFPNPEYSVMNSIDSHGITIPEGGKIVEGKQLSLRNCN